MEVSEDRVLIRAHGFRLNRFDGDEEEEEQWDESEFEETFDFVTPFLDVAIIKKGDPYPEHAGVDYTPRPELGSMSPAVVLGTVEIQGSVYEVVAVYGDD